MKIGAIVQARMSSARLPGKVLRPIREKPMLEYLLERLGRCARLDGVVVATSTDPSDAPLERFCRERGVACWRGPLRNVAARFREVLEAYRFDAFVRVSGDSPLLDPALVGRGVAIFGSGDVDLVTNVFPRSYPSGQSVEVVRSDTFRRALVEMRDADELEHVTVHFYRHAERFRILNFTAERDWSAVTLAVDTPEDAERIAAVLGAMSRPHWEYGVREICELHDRVTRGAERVP